MIRIFQEGGIAMWPVLVLGLVSLVTGARYAWDMESARLRFVVLINVIVAVTALHGMLLDVAAVFSHVTSGDISDELTPRIVMIGLMESSRPGAFAGIFIVLSLCFVAVGVYRDQQRQLRE
jgi:hypothetical protein